MFIIDDDNHSEWCGKFETFNQALSELQARSYIPWDSEPNVAPCGSWKTCGREYWIVEFDSSQEPWREISRELILSVSSEGIVWEKKTYAPN
jgi:hypothetical protein